MQVEVRYLVTHHLQRKKVYRPRQRPSSPLQPPSDRSDDGILKVQAMTPLDSDHITVPGCVVGVYFDFGVIGENLGHRVMKARQRLPRPARPGLPA